MATQGWNGGKGKILLDVYLTSNCWEPDNKTLQMKSRMKTKLFFLSLLFDSYFVKGSWMQISLLMAIKILGILLSPPNLMISVLITTISTKTRMCEKCLWQERRYHTERIYIFSLLAPHILNNTHNDSCFNFVRSMKHFSLDNKHNFTCGEGPPAIGRNNIHG